MILNKVTDLIGNTPILSISVPSKQARLLLKIEKNNPGGSIKDRMARNMLVAALKSGRLSPGRAVVRAVHDRGLIEHPNRADQARASSESVQRRHRPDRSSHRPGSRSRVLFRDRGSDPVPISGSDLRRSTP